MVSTLLQLGQTVYAERKKRQRLELEARKAFFALASRGNTDRSMAFFKDSNHCTRVNITAEMNVMSEMEFPVPSYSLHQGGRQHAQNAISRSLAGR